MEKLSFGGWVFTTWTAGGYDRALAEAVFFLCRVYTRGSAIAERPARRSVSVEILAYCCTNNANRWHISPRSTFSNCHVLFRYLQTRVHRRCLGDPILSSLSRTPTRDGRTDGVTDGPTDGHITKTGSTALAQPSTATSSSRVVLAEINRVLVGTNHISGKAEASDQICAKKLKLVQIAATPLKLS